MNTKIKGKMRIMSVLLAFAMILTVFDLNAVAAYSVSANNVTVGDATLGRSNPYYVNGAASETGTLGEDGCTAYFDASTGKLTLQNINLTGEIGAFGNLGIILKGTNLISDTSINGSAISVTGSLTFSGDGSLKASSIYRTICATGTLTVNGGKFDIDTSSDNDPAFLGQAGVIINDGEIHATAVKINSSSSWAYGIDCYNGYEITINGGKVIAEGNASFGKAVKVSQKYEYRTSSTGTFSTGEAEDIHTSREGTYYEIKVLHTHAWASTWSKGSEGHWYACTNEGCGIVDNTAKKGFAAHTPNIEAATLESAKYCTVCEYVIEEKLTHTHKGTLVKEVPAECTKTGTKAHYTCTCGKVFEDEACKKEITDLKTLTIPELGHNFGTDNVCDVCKYVKEAQKPVPTGDGQNTFMWMALFVVSGGMLLVTKEMNKKKR